MKILLINTLDINGGAARATYRLLKGLRNIGVDAHLLVQQKTSDEFFVIKPEDSISKVFNKISGTLNKKPVELLSRADNSDNFSIQWVPDRLNTHLKTIRPDIVHLNWICGGFVKIESIGNIDKPVVWTLHDMWAFTGGCHHSLDCIRYKNKCGNCTTLNSNRNKDLSYYTWQRKEKSWRNLDLNIVSPSKWLAKCASESSLFSSKNVSVIPNGLNLKIYKQYNKRFAREVFGLPETKKLIIFGAINAINSPLKGFSNLVSALKKLHTSPFSDNVELVVFGSSKPETPFNFGFKTHYMGHLNDDYSLALLYSAADVMAVPSLKEAFCQTASEALACGTPVVAFNATGLKDIVDHKSNGYLAEPYDDNDFANGIKWVLADQKRYPELSRNARQKVERTFEIDDVAKQYKRLYERMLNKADCAEQQSRNQMCANFI